MGTNRTGFFTTVTMAGLAASLVLAGCASQPGSATASPASPPGETAAATPAATPTPTSTSAPATPAATTAPPAAPPAAAPAPPAEPAAPALKTFTFPDGHISFAYPSTWTVRPVNPGAPGVRVTVYDGAGNDLLSMENGVNTGCASAPMSVEVLDRVPVPGMTAPDGTTPDFGFSVEYSTKFSIPDSYAMGLSDPRTLVHGENSGSGCRLVPTGNGGLGARVIFNRPAFPSREAARAWMATEQYAQLKALLVSLNYV